MVNEQRKLNMLKSEWELTIAIYVPSSDSVIENEVVTENDLKGHLGEVWLDGFLRKGFVETPIDDLRFSLKPLFQQDGCDDLCTGFRIETVNPASEHIYRDFSIHSLDLVAWRVSSRLVASGVLQDASQCHYVVVPSRKTATEQSLQDNDVCRSRLFTLTQKKKDPLRCIKAPVAPLLEKSTPRQAEYVQFPVFYTISAFEKAENIARKGGQFDQPVETGALIVGILGSCPDSGELFAMVCEIIELEEAKQSKFSLAPSGSTWQRLRNKMRLLKSEKENFIYTILGQCHGHNFLPGSCKSCKSAKDCRLTSVFVSREDRVWNNAVFESSPYQLCHIFGLNAAGEKADALYGLEDGRLQQRRFHLIRDDHLAAYLKQLHE